ncbi:hypothetical protein [Cylindrospermopsis raciborskii]|uniref:hypothetical protein n=1 Tax=Cylindrospermopsis raciborskii TaxID=77022 RepID=UPI0001C15FD6|nr:hypothetical protein [Cylindrospermopsis raciborskii]EFA73480.1 hypothetical protein CRD_01289 [Raphidiopsis brookii D9]
MKLTNIRRQSGFIVTVNWDLVNKQGWGEDTGRDTQYGKMDSWLLPAFEKLHV